MATPVVSSKHRRLLRWRPHPHPHPSLQQTEPPGVSLASGCSFGHSPQSTGHEPGIDAHGIKKTRHPLPPTTQDQHTGPSPEEVSLRAVSGLSCLSQYWGSSKLPTALRACKRRREGACVVKGPSGRRASSDATFWVSGGVSVQFSPPGGTRVLATVGEDSSKGHLAAGKAQHSSEGSRREEARF